MIGAHFVGNQERIRKFEKLTEAIEFAKALSKETGGLVQLSCDCWNCPGYFFKNGEEE